MRKKRRMTISINRMMRIPRTKEQIEEEKEQLRVLYNWGKRHNMEALTKKGKKFIGVI